MKMKRNTTLSAALFMLMLMLGSLPAFSQQPAPPGFKLCKSTYALCTFSKCTGSQASAMGATVSCGCRVRHDEYSAGEKPCSDPTEVSAGKLKSRYHPIHGYARCSDGSPWAMCLDSKCTVDPTDKTKTKANCQCTIMQGQGDYVVQSACTKEIISSATVDELDSITDFLETQDQSKIKVWPFTVLNPQQK